MSEEKTQKKNEEAEKKTLTLGPKLSLKKSDGVSKAKSGVAVEVKRKRVGHAPAERSNGYQPKSHTANAGARKLSSSELESRMRALQEAQKQQQKTDEERAKADVERAKLAKEEAEKAAAAAKVEENSAPAEVKPVEVKKAPIVDTTLEHKSEQKTEHKSGYRSEQNATRSNYTSKPDRPRMYTPLKKKREPIVIEETTFSAYAPPPRPKTDKPDRPGYKRDESRPGQRPDQRPGQRPGQRSDQRPGQRPQSEPNVTEQGGNIVSRADKSPARDPKFTKVVKKFGEDDASRRPDSPSVKKTGIQERRFNNKRLLTRAADENFEERGRSLASVRRARQKQKSSHHNDHQEQMKITRDVIIPETITVGDLANRMAVRGADVVKSLMKLGMMVTINQIIDADTAELIVNEFGHKSVRVTDSDVEIGLMGEEDQVADLQPRAPVVTVMGHVDHGKTSLLDALRTTDVVGGEAGGITQHIGAYQVSMNSGQKITFIDTPGHAAFSEMRARGATVTDIVVLVVAADDGIKEQTIEAINHAKAAKVPIVVAINKMDKPEANPDRVRSELMQHEIILEEFGGDVMAVEVSAKERLNLEKLEEIILLQAEVLELKANPDRAAHGVIVESRMERGRGTVATVLVQKGTLRVGDTFVAGTEFGKIRALVNDRGGKAEFATPSMPVEVFGFNGVPLAGDEFLVVDSESKAREVAESRQERKRTAEIRTQAKSAMDKIMGGIAAGDIKDLPVVVKSDVQGSLEAIANSLAKISTDEVKVNLLHGGVGGINESDVTLARASGGIIIGFNVRANPQARELARRDGIDIKYYSIIYNLIDDVKGVMGGLLAPTYQENFIGTAEIREVFNVSKVGKIAGCMILDGIVKRGNKVRLLRDDIVIHEGTLKTLRRFKDEVKEVRENFECGMAFENYNDIRLGDKIECFEIKEIARKL